MVTGW